MSTGNENSMETDQGAAANDAQSQSSTNQGDVDNDPQFYQWSDKESNTLNDWTEYAYNLTTFINDLWQEGPAEGKTLPKKPNEKDLRKLMNLEANTPKALFGGALQEYLVKHIITTEKTTIPQLRSGLVTSLDQATEHLKNGYEILKKKNARAGAFCIDYGEWLNLAFELHSIDKLAGKTETTWKEWLESTVGIQDSYARKLRDLARILGRYPRFRKLGLPFSEIYKHKGQIQAMLATDESVAQYWEQV